MQDSTTGVLFGASSEAFASSTGGFNAASSSFTLGSTEATFVVTFQLPSLPPSGSVNVFQLAQSSSSTPGYYSLGLMAMTPAMFGPTFGSSGASTSTSGYVLPFFYYSANSGGSTTSVSTNNQFGALNAALFLPKLFGGWVTLAVSLSATNNMTVYARDSMQSSSLSQGTALSGVLRAACVGRDSPTHLAGLTQTITATSAQGGQSTVSSGTLTGSALSTFVSGMLATPVTTLSVLGNQGATHARALQAPTTDANRLQARGST